MNDDALFLLVTLTPIVLFAASVCLYDWLAQRQRRRIREHRKTA